MSRPSSAMSRGSAGGTGGKGDDASLKGDNGAFSQVVVVLAISGVKSTTAAFCDWMIVLMILFASWCCIHCDVVFRLPLSRTKFGA